MSSGEPIFARPDQVIAALRRFRDWYHPKTRSVLLVGRAGFDTQTDPFRSGFLSNIEERAKLGKRLALLEKRERVLLLMWFTEGLPVTTIAKRLRISRMHCYRLKREGIRRMLDPEPPKTAAGEEVAGSPARGTELRSV